MDLGMLGSDLVVGSGSCLSSSLLSSEPEPRQKWVGSGFLKQQRSEDFDWRSSKVAKTEDNSASKANLQQQQRGPLLRSNTDGTASLLYDHGQQMLSFSSPNSQAVTFPNYYSNQSRNTGYGGMSAGSIQGVLTGLRGPFTQSQWMELEHQALIYKYITANVPVPTNLLFPIRKALDSAGFSSFSSVLGWGAYRMGFSNTTDPEPGRCRRTDGKKWRCSRDAVVDQKYCERHMNRGRHRSRKPVEGQSGHSVSGPTTTTMPPGSGNTSSLGLSHHHQLKNLQPGVSPANRTFLSKENVGEKRIPDSTALSMLAPNNIGLKESPYEGTTRAEFGRVYSDSLLNPLHKSSSLLSCSTYTSLQDINDRENESQLSVHQFMDDWPKSQTNPSAISWPNVDTQADRTKLSISIPAAAASSPANEKMAFSPLRLSRELDSTQMGLGVGNVANEHNQRLTNWIPISWETSVGGPLGEVLHSTSSSAGDCRNSSALNLMTEGWESSPRLGSSPTGVLQKMAFGSLSNSSAGSSPRAESRCNDLLGSTLITPSSLPAL